MCPLRNAKLVSLSSRRRRGSLEGFGRGEFFLFFLIMKELECEGVEG